MGGLRNQAGERVSSTLFNPSFDFGEIPGDAAVCQIEATREAALHLEPVDGGVA